MPPRKKKVDITVDDDSLSDEMLSNSEIEPSVLTLRRRSVARVDSPRPGRSAQKKNNNSKFKNLSRLDEKKHDSSTPKMLVDSPRPCYSAQKQNGNSKVRSLPRLAKKKNNSSTPKMLVDSPRPCYSAQKQNNNSKFKGLPQLAEKKQNFSTPKGPVKVTPRKAFGHRTNLFDDISSISDEEKSKSDETSHSWQDTPRLRKRISYIFSSSESDNDSDDFVETIKKPPPTTGSNKSRKRKLNSTDNYSPIRRCPDLFEDPAELTPKHFLKENLKTYSPRVLPQKRFLTNGDLRYTNGHAKRAKKTDPFNTNPRVRSWVEQMKAEFSDVEMHELCIESD